MKKNAFWLYPLMIAGVLLLFSYGCKKDKNSTTVPATVTDYDGNVYNTVTIGTQSWLVENLKVTHYRNGDAIPNVTSASSWSALTTGAYCCYSNLTADIAKYGLLYNWYAATDSRNLAPTGWHVATNAEYSTLISYLGSNAGAALKEAGTLDWSSSTSPGTNSSGFTGLPGGYCSNTGSFSDIQISGDFWTTTAANTTNADALYLYYGITTATQSNYIKSLGLSVRCVMD